MKKVLKKISAGILLILMLSVLFYGLYWALFESGIFFNQKPTIILVNFLKPISFLILVAIFFRGLISIFNKLEPIPKEIYKDWPIKIKLLIICLLLSLFFVICMLASDHIRAY